MAQMPSACEAGTVFSAQPSQPAPAARKTALDSTPPAQRMLLLASQPSDTIRAIVWIETPNERSGHKARRTEGAEEFRPQAWFDAIDGSLIK